MRCPRCDHDDDRIKETRKRRGGALVRRTRVCGRCGYRWHTAEQSEQVLRKLAEDIAGAAEDMKDAAKWVTGKDGEK